ncbi:hypothetical protein Kuja_0920 [Vibrio phage vB_VchM_Kuja]|uniref:TelA-like protein n=1 Tax=Vibrio phage vB_VchM_Kuja TaxID=2686437 RepID=A0A6B9J956_9CAUD|nr:hypothetical protein HWC83_gp144 [Vibrio phage vB_VchM_Kuja]QGZ16083.1 hypothetical protein Kuja_0920 [Vibrio phage vB_VchM_Kuja]
MSKEDLNKIKESKPSEVTAAQLRSLYNNILTRTDEANRTIGSKMKMIDFDETQKEVQKAYVTISRMSRKESRVGSFLSKILPDAAFNKLYDKAAEESVNGKTVLEISNNLIKSVEERRQRVENIYGDLVDLHNSIVAAHKELNAVIEGIDEHLDEFDPVERVKMIALKSEMLLTSQAHEDNIITSKGTIKTAENALMLYSGMIPSIRAQINDGLSIRSALKELENMTEITEQITELCNAVREDNRAVMTQQLMTTLDKTVISEKQIQRLVSNQNEQAKLHKQLSEQIQLVNNRRENMVNKLQQLGETSKVKTALLNNKDVFDGYGC